MGELDSGARKALLAKTALFAGIVLALCLGALALWVRLSNLSTELDRVAKEKTGLTQEAETLKSKILQKDKDLALAAKQNYQEDLITVQTALKDVNQKLSEAIRARATAENTSVNLDSRLKNTTTEFTRTLDDLKKTRETLAGIDGQYKVKFAQVADNLKAKEDQLTKISQKLKDKESEFASYQGRVKDSSDAVRTYERKVKDFEGNIAALNKTVADKERALALKDDELKKARQDAAKSPRSSGRISDESAGSVAALENEKADLERQVASASSRIFDQKEQLRDLETKVRTLTDSLADRGKALSDKEGEISRYRQEIQALKKDIAGLKSGSADMSGSAAVFSEAQADLERRVGDLENEKKDLQDRLARVQKGGSKSDSSSESVSKDPFLDRNFRILTETLVKKEEQIKLMQAELDNLHQEQKTWEFGSGDRQKRLAELEVLVTTLTRQLGDYAGMIQKKDGELKVDAQKIAELSDEVEAQKVAAMSIQKQLAEARARQEKTFQTLTQIMGMNAGQTSAASAAVSEPAQNQDGASEKAGGAPAAGYSGYYPETTAGSTDSDTVKKNVDELRRKVEVMLQSR